MSDLQATWYAVRATGAWPHEAEYIYTSAEPPVEAAEHDRVLAHLTAAYQENDTLVAQHNALDDQLAAATQRAEAAERELAAVPVEAIRFYHTPYGELSREGSLARRSECRRLIAEWLAQSEGQP